MKLKSRTRYVCSECKDISSTTMKPVKGIMTPYCKCGKVKDAVQVEEADVRLNMIQIQPSPEVHAFRNEYNEFLISEETQEKINSGQYSPIYTDQAGSTRKD